MRDEKHMSVQLRSVMIGVKLAQGLSKHKLELVNDGLEQSLQMLYSKSAALRQVKMPSNTVDQESLHRCRM
jgi:CHAD domain-containing protein